MVQLESAPLKATGPRPVRLGVHGSPDLAAGIVAAAGRAPEDVQFVPYDVRDPMEPLRDGRLDLMLVKYSVQEPDIVTSRPVAFDGRALIVAAGHPLAGRDSVSLEEAADHDAFSCPENFPPYVWDRVVPPHTPSGRPIRRVHPMTTLEAMLAVLTSTEAVHVSFQSLDTYGLPGVEVIPVHDLPPAPVSLAWLDGRQLDEHVAAFVHDAEREAGK